MSLDIIKCESVTSMHHLFADYFLPITQFGFIARLKKSLQSAPPPPETFYMCAPEFLMRVLYTQNKSTLVPF